MSTASPLSKKNPSTTPAAGPTLSAPATVKRRRTRGVGLWISVLIGVAILIGALYFLVISPRLAAGNDLNQEQKISSQRIVVYALARLAAPKVELPLPGTVEAFQQASIYARTNGYVKRWLVDIGDVVHEGDLLAELDTPEVDQQLGQAKATAEQAKAAVDIAQLAADRWSTMVKAHAVSQEEADEKNAALSEAKATFDADEANVGQLTALENFKHIVAPFTGKITYRNIEVGNLVSAGTGSNSVNTGTTELYRIAQTDPLRVYVDVPEDATRAIHPGVEADLHVADYPDRVFHGEVARSAGALDATSRTLRTEIRVSNPDGALLPGAYAEVRLNLVDGAPAILIPANTLIVNSSGTQVALIQSLDGIDSVHFLPVKVGRDFGTEVEILQDVKEGDRLVTNPAADLSEGAVVTAKALPVPPATPPIGTSLKP
jgi:RND family efflux transporter MFP subunit